MASRLRDYAVAASTTVVQNMIFLVSLTSNSVTWATSAILGKYSASATNSKDGKEKRQFPEPDITDDPDTFTVPVGRQLGFSRFGVPSTRTIFYLHGFPDSCLGAGIFDEPARKLGLRIIGIDRPGVGLSSPRPGRTFLTDAEDARARTKHLELRSYAIVGASGGGPYALACAHNFPAAHLKGIALVCAFGSLDFGIGEMKFGNKVLFYGYRCAPWFVRNVVGKLQGAMLRMSDDKLMATMERANTYHRFRWPRPKPKDVQTFHENKGLFKWLIYGTRQFFKQGFDAFLEEGRLLTGSLGFRIEDIREDLPVQLWYGKQDTNVPLQMGEQIAVRLGGRAAFYVEDETHVSMWFNQRERILEGLAQCL